MHSWGDTDFDWNGLFDAMRYIQVMSKRRAGIRPQLKEKWGSIRVEFEWMWGWSNDETEKNRQWEAFLKVVLEAVDRQPHLSVEILDDILWGWKDEEPPPHIEDLYIKLEETVIGKSSK